MNRCWKIIAPALRTANRKAAEALRRTDPDDVLGRHRAVAALARTARDCIRAMRKARRRTPREAA